MSTMSAVVLERVGPPVALQIPNLTISVLTPRQGFIQILSSGLTCSEVRVRGRAAEVSSRLAIVAASRNPLAPPGALTGDGVQRIRHSRLCPIEDIPHGVRGTVRSGQATDLPAGDPAGRRCCPAPPGTAATSVAPVHLLDEIAGPLGD
jgi:hypothetical protein